MERRGIKAGELAAELMKNPEAPVWCGAWNGYVDTYAVVYHVFKFKYEAVSNDFFGTPGRMDKRLFEPGTKDEDEIFYVGSEFGRVPNKKVDFGDDNIDYPIKTINGEDGDPHLVWRLSGFESDDGEKTWKKEGDGWEVKYDTESLTLDANNFRESRRFVGRVEGIETLRNIIEVLKIDLDIWT
jgi:hypothetical protein